MRYTACMTFSEALDALKQYRSIARTGWNGRGMYLELTSEVLSKPFIVMKTVDDQFVPWTASQTDLLSDDWTIVR